jgi:hypothetical protein
MKMRLCENVEAALELERARAEMRSAVRALRDGIPSFLMGDLMYRRLVYGRRLDNARERMREVRYLQ